MKTSFIFEAIKYNNREVTMEDNRTLLEIAESMQEFDPTARAEAKAEAGGIEEKQLTVEELEF